MAWKGLTLNTYYSETNYDMLGIVPYWNFSDDIIARHGFADLTHLSPANR